MTRELRLLCVLAGGALIAATAFHSAARGAPAARRGHLRGLTEGMDCSACHTEAGWDSLGAGAGQGFDHARTGFPLTGRHRQAGCADCHATGTQISRACDRCHRDPHQQRLGSDCSECHSALSFQLSDALQKHRNTRLPLTGIHALLDCTECHRRGTEPRFSSVPANCWACHADEYRSPDVHPRHTGTPGDPSQPAFPTDCAQCHRATGWSPAVVDPARLRAALAQQALTAPPSHELMFPIARGAHRGAACGDCHADSLRPGLARCTGCHAHGALRLRAQHGDRPVDPRARACLACHPGGAAR